MQRLDRTWAEERASPVGQAQALKSATVDAR
jgi:hypothetical protein